MALPARSLEPAPPVPVPGYNGETFLLNELAGPSSSSSLHTHTHALFPRSVLSFIQNDWFISLRPIRLSRSSSKPKYSLLPEAHCRCTTPCSSLFPILHFRSHHVASTITLYFGLLSSIAMESHSRSPSHEPSCQPWFSTRNGFSLTFLQRSS
jgi:hypothetical protein